MTAPAPPARPPAALSARQHLERAASRSRAERGRRAADRRAGAEQERQHQNGTPPPASQAASLTRRARDGGRRAHHARVAVALPDDDPLVAPPRDPQVHVVRPHGPAALRRVDRVAAEDRVRGPRASRAVVEDGRRLAAVDLVAALADRPPVERRVPARERQALEPRVEDVGVARDGAGGQRRPAPASCTVASTLGALPAPLSEMTSAASTTAPTTATAPARPPRRRRAGRARSRWVSRRSRSAAGARASRRPPRRRARARARRARPPPGPGPAPGCRRNRSTSPRGRSPGAVPSRARPARARCRRLVIVASFVLSARPPRRTRGRPRRPPRSRRGTPPAAPR